MNLHRTQCKDLTAHLLRRVSHSSACPPRAPASFTLCCPGTDHIPQSCTNTLRQHQLPWNTEMDSFSYSRKQRHFAKVPQLGKGDGRTLQLWVKPVEVRKLWNLQQVCNNLCWMRSWNASIASTHKTRPDQDTKAFAKNQTEQLSPTITTLKKQPTKSAATLTRVFSP